MSRRQKVPLRSLNAEERKHLSQLSRARAESAALVARAKALLAVADGSSFTEAAKLAGRRSGDGVAQLVARFNQVGLAALAPRHGGGQPKRYTAAEQERILKELRRTPDRESDGTATWSLSTLQRSLRQAPDGLSGVSTFTIWCVLREAGLRWGRDRSWCQTGQVIRKRKSGTVTVEDPNARAKQT
jgi:transposase